MQVLPMPSPVPTSQAAGDTTANDAAMTAPGSASQNAPPERPYAGVQPTETVPVGTQDQPR